MKHPNTPKEYDKEMKRFEGEMAKIDTSKVSEFGSMNWNYAPRKSRNKSFIGGMVLMFVINILTIIIYFEFIR